MAPGSGQGSQDGQILRGAHLVKSAANQLCSLIAVLSPQQRAIVALFLKLPRTELDIHAFQTLYRERL